MKGLAKASLGVPASAFLRSQVDQKGFAATLTSTRVSLHTFKRVLCSAYVKKQNAASISSSKIIRCFDVAHNMRRKTACQTRSVEVLESLILLAVYEAQIGYGLRRVWRLSLAAALQPALRAKHMTRHGIGQLQPCGQIGLKCQALVPEGQVGSMTEARARRRLAMASDNPPSRCLQKPASDTAKTSSQVVLVEKS